MRRKLTRATPHRVASGDYQLGQDTYTTAESEYTSVADLREMTTKKASLRKRQECLKLHLDMASAWGQMGKRGRMAELTMKVAFSLVMGDEQKQPIN